MRVACIGAVTENLIALLSMYMSMTPDKVLDYQIEVMLIMENHFLDKTYSFKFDI